MINNILIFFVLVSFNINAQTNKTVVRNTHKTYISLEKYEKKYNTTFSEIDTLNLKFHKKDTLVWDKNAVRPKGISVNYEYKDENFLNIYKPIAFKKKKDSTSKHKTFSMKYWKEDIRVFFSKSISKKNKRDFMRFAKETLSEIDSLNIKEVNKIEDSNYTIYTSSDYDYDSRTQNFKSTDYYMHWKNGSQIYKNSIKIMKDEYFNDWLELNAMKDYFIRSLGHFQFSTNLNCSYYFSGCLNKKDIVLSKLDKEIIKYHYSYGICKGTNQKIFEENHKKAKEVLKEYNHLVKFFHHEN